MVLRLLLLAMLFGLAIRFVARLIQALFGRPTIGATAARKKPRITIDETQIQDADFKDL